MVFMVFSPFVPLPKNPWIPKWFLQFLTCIFFLSLEFRNSSTQCYRGFVARPRVRALVWICERLFCFTSALVLLVCYLPCSFAFIYQPQRRWLQTTARRLVISRNHVFFQECACSPSAVKNSIISKTHQKCQCAWNPRKTNGFAWFRCAGRLCFCLGSST